MKTDNKLLRITLAQPEGEWPEGLFRRVLDVRIDDELVDTDSAGPGEAVNFTVRAGADVVVCWCDVWGPTRGFSWEPHQTQLGFTAKVGRIVPDPGGPVVLSIGPAVDVDETDE